VDAIVGAHSLMHTVVESWCIGCALCLPACPVDCIEMVHARGTWTPAEKQAAKHRAGARTMRLRKGAIVEKRDRKAIVAAILASKKR
jgi:electron transport complex protein RnfB